MIRDIPLPSLSKKIATALIVGIPFAATLSMALIWEWIAVPSAMIVGVVLYLLTIQAVSVSFHRELTHRAVRLKPGARYVEAFLALLSIEGTIRDWCAYHRMHHEKTDEEGDPHSPHLDGPVTGFIYAHLGWFFHKGQPNFERYIPDLLKDRGLMKLDQYFGWIVALSFILPGFLTLIFEPSWRGFIAGVFWGGLVRVFWVHHITWSVNSICHLWGTRPFKSDDQSTNNAIFGLLSAGEGWHRNHHAFPQSARIGLRWWEFDLGWIVILFLKAIGQVEGEVKVPSKKELQAKKV